MYSNIAEAVGFDCIAFIAFIECLLTWTTKYSVDSISYVPTRRKKMFISEENKKSETSIYF